MPGGDLRENLVVGLDVISETLSPRCMEISSALFVVEERYILG